MLSTGFQVYLGICLGIITAAIIISCAALVVVLERVKRVVGEVEKTVETVKGMARPIGAFLGFATGIGRMFRGFTSGKGGRK